MRRPLPRRLVLVVAVLIVGAVLTACADDPADTTPAAPQAPEAPGTPDPDAGFDPERSPALAEAYLGVAEAEIDETVMVRILRRGDEQLAGTMDLRPGRLNLELDEDDDGTFRVTRVVVETDDGSLVIE